jgi:carotenoid 1,2-hydratase
VAPGGYLWWYLDALADDGRYGLTIIAFVGSVFSPYYRWQRWRGRPDAEQHVALNVALYGGAKRRWTMTERGKAQLSRSRRDLVIGPSRLHWDGSSLCIDIDEVGMPLPRRVRGQVRVFPSQLCTFNAPLDAAARHRWGPIAPSARVEVDLPAPGLRWSGAGYLDSNEGDEPVERGFRTWDWSRAGLRDGSTAVLYDLRPAQAAAPERLIAMRFAPDGQAMPFDAPPRQALPRSAWGLQRMQRADARPRVLQTLEDTPFYTRSVLDAALLGERVTAMHETLQVPRLQSLAVAAMLPFRMPRRA